MEFVWECIVIFCKGSLGMVFLVIAIGLIGIILSCLGALLGIFNFIKEYEKRKKPKYEGQPIIIEGGKDNDRKE